MRIGDSAGVRIGDSAGVRIGDSAGVRYGDPVLVDNDETERSGALICGGGTGV